jgi:alkylation response protein AidB-like acyl-CoA dehydrogenase
MNLEPDPVRGSLQSAVRARLRSATGESAWAALCAMGAPAFDAPPEAGGLGLGLTASTAVAEELGRSARSSRYLAVALAIDAAGDCPSADKLVGGGYTAGFDDEDERVDLVVDISTCPDLAIARARIRHAAYVYGLGRGALATAAAHTSRRKQFDRALREFQSIAFRLAAAHVELEALRLTIARAVWLADTGRPHLTEAKAALALAAETASATIGMVMQVCGVRAMTRELRVSRYYLQIRREATRLGRPGDLWREVGLARQAARQAGVMRPAW